MSTTPNSGKFIPHNLLSELIGSAAPVSPAVDVMSIHEPLTVESAQAAAATAAARLRDHDESRRELLTAMDVAELQLLQLRIGERVLYQETGHAVQQRRVASERRKRELLASGMGMTPAEALGE